MYIKQDAPPPVPPKNCFFSRRFRKIQQSKVVNQHTELEHTPSNLYQWATTIPFIVGDIGGLPGVWSRGVLQFWKQNLTSRPDDVWGTTPRDPGCEIPFQEIGAASHGEVELVGGWRMGWSWLSWLDKNTPWNSEIHPLQALEFSGSTNLTNLPFLWDVS